KPRIRSSSAKLGNHDGGVHVARAFRPGPNIRDELASAGRSHNRVEELVAEGDRVVARLTYTGTHAGALLGIAPTGRRVSYAGVAVFRIASGQIAEGWVWGDLHGLLGQLRGEA